MNKNKRMDRRTDAITPSVKVAPSVLHQHQRPRAITNADMHSVLDAVQGLTSLSTPDSSASGKSTPCPIIRNPSIEASKVAEAPQDPVKDTPVLENPMFPKPDLKNPIAPTHMHSTNMISAAPISARPPANYLTSLQQSYTASAPATAWPSALTNSLPWSSIHPAPAATGFGSLNVPLVNAHSANPFSAMAMDRFSVRNRVAAMDPSAAFVAATSARPSPYHPNSYYYPPHPSYIAPLPLPTPYRAAPIPNSKNFPETLFDVISCEEHVHVITWLPHGRGFIIHDKQRFASMVLSHYFDSAKFTSFTRRLKRWNFKRVPRGPELGAYYNKNFIRDQPELVQKMRYRMDGKFEEGKKSGDEKNEEKDKLEDQIEKEGGATAQESLPTKELDQEQKPPELMPLLPPKIPGPNSQETQANESLSLTNQGPPLHQHQHMHRPYPMINTNFAYQDRPLPLPKRIKVSKKNAPTVHKSKSTALNRRNHRAAAVESSLFSQGYPKLPAPHELGENHLIEIQREIRMNRSMLSHEVATVIPASGLGPSGSSTISNHIHSDNRRMIDVERIERIIEAERMLGLARMNTDYHGGNAALPH